MVSQGENTFFGDYIHTVYQRSQALYQNAIEFPWRQPEVIIGCLEELQIALEELRVAEEELRLQNEELLTTKQAVEAEQQRYQELFEFAPDGYLVTDLQGTVREANQVAGTLLNINSKHLLNQSITEFVIHDQRRSFWALLDQLPKINRVQEWEVQMCKRDDGLFNAAITVETVRNLREQPIALRWLLRDVTTRKQAEEQLRQVQMQNLELRELDRLKSQFLSTISHELRTPLSAILGFSKLLQIQNQAGDDRLIDMTERITRNGKQLLKMIDELLSFSRLQANGLDLHPEPLDLAELATETAGELQSLADQKLLELEVNLPPDGLPIVNDATRLRQVVANLLSNAIKFTDVGKVTLTVCELPEGRIALFVSDTGIGINPEDQTKIFQEFWQVDQSTSRLKGGSGLGLAICKSIVQLMKGSITVESQPGVGSTFRVELPRWL